MHIYQHLMKIMGGLPKPGSMLAEILLARREESSAWAGLIAAFELVSACRSV
jgi:hypothetical protein